MDIKINKLSPAILGLLVLLGGSCKKQINCPKMGYEYTFSKSLVHFNPSYDSIRLGSDIQINASVPKTFFDSQNRYSVTLRESKIMGPLSVSKATNNSTIPIIGAIEDVELIPIIGNIIKDSIQFSQGQLMGFRTAYWDGMSNDSFRLKVTIKPKIQGVFFVTLGQQGNRDADCALYKYFLPVSNPDQHLYLFSLANNGYIDNYSKIYTYCFKVY